VKSIQYKLLLGLVMTVLFAACAPVKPLSTWKDEAYTGPLGKTLVIAVARQEYIRKQFENVLVDQLRTKGVEAIPSYEVLPAPSTRLDREAVIAKVNEIGVQNVLLARSIDKKEIVNHQWGGPFFAPTAVYSDGWYSCYEGFLVYPQIEYDTTYFTVAVNLFAIGNKKPVWSYLNQVRVGDARQKAINQFVPVVMQELVTAGLVN